jgi:broad specificity polyphosphatase/5'/3'-nucleotidase SurE
MAIAVTTPTPGKFGFILNGTSADASGCEELKATPGAGYNIVVDHLTINNGANAISITIGSGAAAGAVETALIGPVAMAANTSIQFDFPYGMVLTANKSLTVDASGAGAICIFAQGRVIP